MSPLKFAMSTRPRIAARSCNSRKSSTDKPTPSICATLQPACAVSQAARRATVLASRLAELPPSAPQGSKPVRSGPKASSKPRCTCRRTTRALLRSSLAPMLSPPCLISVFMPARTPRKIPPRAPRGAACVPMNAASSSKSSAGPASSGPFGGASQTKDDSSATQSSDGTGHHIDNSDLRAARLSRQVYFSKKRSTSGLRESIFPRGNLRLEPGRARCEKATASTSNSRGRGR
mmetsp:Transcript_149306/g.479438  ORF Transcript_149306/g.479438 Transcript_149306/m.479438 type:complete len:233 (-) Transcript_149306:91-789(-)